MNLVVALAVGALFAAGVHRMLRGDAVQMALGTLLVTNAAILLLVSATFGAERAPFTDEDPALVADPIPQALALTAIVIGFGTTVLLLRVALAVERTHGTVSLEELAEAELRDAGEREEAR